MADLLSDEAQAVFRPFGGGLPRKGKGSTRKKKVPAALLPPEATSDTPASETVAEPPPPPPPKLVRPVFEMPPPDSAVWEEVLTEVAPIPRPPSVPVKVVFSDSKELPHWHEMPLETPGLQVAATVETSSAPAPGTTPDVEPIETSPRDFVPKEDAELLGDWLQDMELHHLEAAARDIEREMRDHVVLAHSVERIKLRTRRIGLVARKVYDGHGGLTGYTYPRAGHEKIFVALPWTQHLPRDEDNDLLRKLRLFASRVRRMKL